ncbi:helix-turn-helix domain-containing protein [Actinomadura kijaniata]|uniref:helix-turn-helix domain-containing protein n=1 Tax=Actinomadura kijaniata TaxID=46161 RepID=UPI003F19CC47
MGLTRYGDRRCVPGLRREEIAQLAGVSASYYTRLEQGQSLNASAEVLDAIARALRLDHHERAHLHDLARAGRGRPAAPPATVERIPPATRDLLRAMGDVPAVVTGRRGDVLGWTRTGHALFAGHTDLTAPERPEDRPNTARIVFLDAHSRDLYVDREAKARAVTEHLRLVAGRHPEDRELAALIGDLSMRSREFAALWADHRVRACELSLVVATAEPGSPSEAALLLLAHGTA